MITNSGNNDYQTITINDNNDDQTITDNDNLAITKTTITTIQQ